MNKLSTVTKEIWEELYTKHTVTELAELFDVTHTAILYQLKKHDIERRRKGKFIHGQQFSEEFLQQQEKVCGKMEQHPAWRGGSYVDEAGYRQIYVGDGKYEREHRIIAAKKLGRPLSPEEDVHHIDGDKLNNDEQNLLVVDKSLHNEIHEAAKEEKYG